MVGMEMLSGDAQAAVLVGVVLLEAIVLYVGYGALEQVASEYFIGLLRGD
jgi:hypothetical protein